MTEEINPNFYWDCRFAQLAKFISLWSKDPSTKVGSVIVRPDKTVCSVGFNGFPRGIPDHPEWYADRTKKLKIVKHAEVNALHFARDRVEDYTLYVYPLPPCTQCAGDIIQRGIKRVVAIVPPEQSHRLENSPDFSFELTQEMFQLAGVEFVLISDAQAVAALESQ